MAAAAPGQSLISPFCHDLLRRLLAGRTGCQAGHKPVFWPDVYAPSLLPTPPSAGLTAFWLRFTTFLRRYFTSPLIFETMGLPRLTSSC